MKQRYKGFRINKFLLGFVVLLFGVVIVLAGLEVAEIDGRNGNSNLAGNFERVLLTPEENIILEGTSEVIIVDYFEENRAETLYYIKTDQGERYKLNFVFDPYLISGKRIRISGSVESSQAASSDESVIDVLGFEVLEDDSVVAGVEENPNLGEQKTLVVLVNFPASSNITPFTKEDINDTIFSEGNNWSVNSFYQENSYSKVWLAGSVFGWHTLQIPNGECTSERVKNEAIAAVDPEIDFNIENYKRLIIYMISGDESGCTPGLGYVGLGTIGLSSVETEEGIISMSVSWIATSQIEDTEIYTKTTAHELGHNFGLSHANDLECGNTSLGEECDFIEYGNSFDVMGGQSYTPLLLGSGHFHALHKERVDWFESSNILEATKNGIYRIEPLETNTSGVKGLKIFVEKGNIRENDFFVYYYIEYRRSFGFDGLVYNIATQYDLENNLVFDGAFINVCRIGEFVVWRCHLLDFSPHITPLDPRTGFVLITEQIKDSLDSVLRDGETFRDPENNITITVLRVTDEYLEIKIGEFICGNSILEEGEQCDDGNSGSFDGCSSTCTIEPYYNVFATSSIYDGRIKYGSYTGTIAADMLCSMKAREGGFASSKKWKAWLSDSKSSASSRLMKSQKAYRLRDGNIVANNWNDLIDGSLDNTINIDERGSNVIGTAWTGTLGNGSSSGSNCIGWTSNASSGAVGTSGEVNESNSGWTNRGSGYCNVQKHLFCFEQPSCGNGIVEGSELCDDGNFMNNDGCSTLCRIGSGGVGGGVKEVAIDPFGPGSIA